MLPPQPGCPLHLPELRADLVVAAVHRLLLGYGALTMLFNLTLNLVIDFLKAAHPYLLTTVRESVCVCVSVNLRVSDQFWSNPQVCHYF